MGKKINMKKVLKKQIKGAIENNNLDELTKLIKVFNGQIKDLIFEGRENLFHIALKVENISLDILSVLLREKVSIHSIADDRFSTLQRALQFKNAEAAKFLISNNADASYWRGPDHPSSIHIYAAHGNTDETILKHLIEAQKTFTDADADILYDFDEYSSFFPIDLAAMRGHSQTVQLLLEHKASGGEYCVDEGEVEILEGKFSSALRIAMDNNDATTEKILLDNGACFSKGVYN